jgi:hypothetical protein
MVSQTLPPFDVEAFMRDFVEKAPQAFRAAAQVAHVIADVFEGLRALGPSPVADVVDVLGDLRRADGLMAPPPHVLPAPAAPAALLAAPAAAGAPPMLGGA